MSFLAAKESGPNVRKAWLSDMCRDFFALWKSHEDELEERRAIAAKKGITLKNPDTPFFATHDDWYKCREAVCLSYTYFCLPNHRVFIFLFLFSNWGVGLTITQSASGTGRGINLKLPSLPIP